VLQFPSLLVAEQKFMTERKTSPKKLPQYVTDLEAIYGGPIQTIPGDAVFYEVLKPEDDINHAAMKKYKHFIGKDWRKAYRDAWKMVYSRSMDAPRAIISELRSLTDSDRDLSGSVVLERFFGDSEANQQVLVAVFDDPKVIELTIHKMGDGDVISGAVIAGRRANGEATFLLTISD